MTVKYVVARLVRLVLISAVALFGFAALVGRFGTRESSDGVLVPPDGSLAMARPAPVLDGFLFWTKDRSSYMLDPETGQFSPTKVRNGEVLRFPSAAPWRDGLGRQIAVGRWTSRSDGRHNVRWGLAEYTVPDGVVLDRVECDPVPNGPACWYPGQAARLLYPAADGNLYQVAFTGAGDRDPLPPGEHTARPLTWRCDRPGVGPVLMREAVWTNEPGLRERLLVSLLYPYVRNGHVVNSNWQIWWLQLSADGESIEAAGRLTVPDPEVGGDLPQEHFPSLASGPNGLILAYLSHEEGLHRMELRVVPVNFDPETDLPSARIADSRRVAVDRMAARPHFSVDGQWVVSAPFDADPARPAERYAVASVLPRPAAQPMNVAGASATTIIEGVRANRTSQATADTGPGFDAASVSETSAVLVE